MSAAPVFSRVLHQCRTEWRHQAGLVALWLVVLVLRQWHGANEVKTRFSKLSIVGLDVWLEAGVVLTAAALAWRCVSADTPSNTDTFSLTRPAGQAALWWGKVLFLFSSVILPTLLVTATTWGGFGLGVGQWTAMAGAVVLAGGLVCAAVGTLTALASSSRQVITLAVLAVVAAGVWLGMQEGFRGTAKATLEQAGTFVGAIFALVGLMVAWWLVTVPRMRWTGMCCMAGVLAAAPLIAGAWQIDWITPPPLSHANASKLGLKFGKADPADKTPGRGLWPTLRITGLGRDEVASIAEFAPINEGQEWPPEGSHSDLQPNDSGNESWLHTDHVRALFKHHPPTTLWRQSIGNNAMYNGRKTLDAVLQSLRLKREDAITRRWRLRLVVHEMKRVTTVPFRQLWTQDNEFLIRPGMKVEFNAYAWLREAWEMHGRVHRLSSAVLSADSHRPARVRGRDLGDDFFLVLEDTELRENAAMHLQIVQRSGRYTSYRNQGSLWQINENQGCEVRMWTPREQKVILQATDDEWIDRMNASLWHAEERGTVEFELTPEQMAQVIPPPPPPAAKPAK